MICPFCGNDTQVYDTRPDGERIRRRRKCKVCGRRFTTYESFESLASINDETIQRLRIVVCNLSQIIAELGKG